VPSKPVLRVAEPSDAPALAAIYAPYVRDTAVSFEYEAPDAAEFARRMGATLERFPYLVACEPDGDRAVLGYTYVGPFKERAAYDWAVETSIYVDGRARGRGAGRLLHDGLELACGAMGVLSLEACIAYPDQGGSVGFHDHLGYRMVGRFEQCGYKLGRWWDMVWMEKHLAPHTEAPHAVLPFPQVREAVERGLAGRA
jgi:phosphinothricin acetyltransferase